MKSNLKGHTILIATNNPANTDFIDNTLKKEGYHFYFMKSGDEVFDKTKQLIPSLILIDSQLTDPDGMEICQNIRNSLISIQPLIAILTEPGDEFAKIAGYEAGADDCFHLPTRNRLLACKIHALINRICSDSSDQKADNTEIQIDRKRFVVIRNGHDIQFSRMEFEILDLMASRPDRVFSREQIMTIIWGTKSIVGKRTIDVHIRKIREKLGDSYIRTIKGVGYTFNQ